MAFFDVIHYILGIESGIMPDLGYNVMKMFKILFFTALISLKVFSRIATPALIISQTQTCWGSEWGNPYIVMDTTIISNNNRLNNLFIIKDTLKKYKIFIKKR